MVNRGNYPGFGLGLPAALTAPVSLSITGPTPLTPSYFQQLINPTLRVTSSADGQSILLPSALNCQTLGAVLTIQNMGNYTIPIRRADGTVVCFIGPLGFATLSLADNTTKRGIWQWCGMGCSLVKATRVSFTGGYFQQGAKPVFLFNNAVVVFTVGNSLCSFCQTSGVLRSTPISWLGNGTPSLSQGLSISTTSALVVASGTNSTPNLVAQVFTINSDGSFGTIGSAGTSTVGGASSFYGSSAVCWAPSLPYSGSYVGASLFAAGNGTYSGTSLAPFYVNSSTLAVTFTTPAVLGAQNYFPQDGLTFVPSQNAFVAAYAYFLNAATINTSTLALTAGAAVSYGSGYPVVTQLPNGSFLQMFAATANSAGTSISGALYTLSGNTLTQGATASGSVSYISTGYSSGSNPYFGQFSTWTLGTNSFAAACATQSMVQGVGGGGCAGGGSSAAYVTTNGSNTLAITATPGFNGAGTSIYCGNATIDQATGNLIHTALDSWTPTQSPTSLVSLSLQYSTISPNGIITSAPVSILETTPVSETVPSGLIPIRGGGLITNWFSIMGTINANIPNNIFYVGASGQSTAQSGCVNGGGLLGYGIANGIGVAGDSSGTYGSFIEAAIP